MRKFLIPPEQSSYVVEGGESVVSTKLNGGASRYRKDILNPSSLVSVKWVFSPLQYEYFRAFYKASTSVGSESFLIDLIIDEALQLTEHVVYFIPQTISLTSVQGNSYRVKASLEAIPKLYQDNYFEAKVFLYENFGENQEQVESFFNLFENFINVDLPSLEVFSNE
jgi:hypothetical protein